MTLYSDLPAATRYAATQARPPVYFVPSDQAADLPEMTRNEWADFAEGEFRAAIDQARCAEMSRNQDDAAVADAIDRARVVNSVIW